MMVTAREDMMVTAGENMTTAVTSITSAEAMGMGMAAGMTGVDIDIMITATGNGFMWSRRSTMHHLHGRVSMYFFRPFISIPKEGCLA